MRALYITLSVIVIDQFTKLYIHGISIPILNINFEGMYLGESIQVIGEFFKITFIENPGMAFGFDPGSDFKLIISLFSLAASIGLLFYLFIVKHKSLTLRIAIALILGGAIGNLIDRMFYGYLFDYAPIFYGKVVDFFDFDFFNFSILGRTYDRWPIFNIADAAVSIGVLILLFFYKQPKEIKNEVEPESPQQINENKTSDDILQDNIKDNKIDNEQIDRGKDLHV